jgi:RNA polymerase sigma-70 factor (sigma-E family)
MTFEEFAAQRLPTMVRFAAALAGNRADAEDLIQEVLVRAHRHWPTISGLDRPDAYVRRMIVNEFISAHRRSWRLLPKGRPEDLDTRTTADHASQYTERDSLIGELTKLPRRQRAVLMLRYYEGLSDAEIADVLSCRPGTVRAYAARALAALRVELGAPERPTPALAERGNR